MQVAVHCITFTTSKEVVKDRVEKRVDHVVMGIDGAKLAELVMPTYHSRSVSINECHGDYRGCAEVCTLYRRDVSGGRKEHKQQGKIQLQPCNTRTEAIYCTGDI